MISYTGNQGFDFTSGAPDGNMGSGGELEVGSMYGGLNMLNCTYWAAFHRWTDSSIGLISIWATMILANYTIWLK